MLLNACGIQLVKVIRAQFGVRLLGAQDMVDDHQHAVRDCHNGLFCPIRGRYSLRSAIPWPYLLWIDLQQLVALPENLTALFARVRRPGRTAHIP